jgi:hypothetical protein
MTPRDSLLVAQLSQATIAVLGALNRERRENPHSAEVINRILKSAQYNLRNSLINQGTLIGHAYLTMVWLWKNNGKTSARTSPTDRSTIRSPLGPILIRPCSNGRTDWFVPHTGRFNHGLGMFETV